MELSAHDAARLLVKYAAGEVPPLPVAEVLHRLHSNASFRFIYLQHVFKAHEKSIDKQLDRDIHMQMVCARAAGRAPLLW